MKTNIQAGSEEHKQLFCKQFMDTYQDYDPTTLPWPTLSDADLERLRGAPFWQEVYHTERRAGAIVDAFIPHVMLMFEETRHIVFFINYMAWREKQRGLGSMRRTLKSLRFYGRAGSRLMGMVKRGQASNGGKDFAVTQTSMFLEGFSFRHFVEDCYRENARRMSIFDPDLMQPRLLPSIAGLALRGMKAWDAARPWRKSAPADLGAA